MKKSLTTLFWSIYLLISAQTTYISPDHLYTNPSSTFTTNIKVTDISNLGSFQMNLNFNPEYIQANSSIIGEFLSSTGRTVFTVANEIDNINGQITLAATTLGNELPGASGEGILFQIEWTADGDINEILDTELLINSLQLTQPNGTLIPTEINNGLITINNDLNTNITSSSVCPGIINIPINVNGFLGVNEIFLSLETPPTGLIYDGFQNTNIELTGLEVEQNGNSIEITYNGDLATIGEGILVELIFEAENNNENSLFPLEWNTDLSYYSGTSGNIPSSFNNAEIEVNPLPSSAENINGVSNTCSGEQLVPYSIESILHADNYIWELNPSAAGEIISGDEEIHVNFSNSYVGDAILSVSGENNCGIGEASELNITINHSLENISTPIGPDDILTNMTPISNYYIEEENIESFEWILIPSSAGEAFVNNENCDITWNSGFVGIAELSVNVSNSCNNISSETLEINVDNNVGQEEILKPMTNSISVAPNPIHSESSISYFIKTSGHYTLRLLDLSGKTQIIYFENTETKSGEFTLAFTANQLLPGNYILSLEKDNQVIDSKKIILK